MDISQPTTEQLLENFPQITDINFLDKGGFKTVYKITVNNTAEALKVVCIPKLSDLSKEEATRFTEECVARVAREVKVLKECDHPNIVKLGTIDFCSKLIDDFNYVIYSEEFIQGKNLHDIIGENHKPTEEEVRILLHTLIDTTKSLWSLPGKYVHRDIKPKNIMKTSNSSRPFVLLDLGVAFSITETQLTYNANQRGPIGTPKYLSPEMLKPDYRNSLDYRSDLYCIGTSVFEYASGIHPLAENHDDLLATFSRIATQTPKSLALLREDFKPELSKLIAQLLKKNPALRPGNLKTLLNSVKGNL